LFGSMKEKVFLDSERLFWAAFLRCTSSRPWADGRG
jgi:hypothetical protein